MMIRNMAKKHLLPDHKYNICIKSQDNSKILLMLKNNEFYKYSLEKIIQNICNAGRINSNITIVHQNSSKWQTKCLMTTTTKKEVTHSLDH